jgi:coenzyme F420 hydrogenase subunit beta
MFTQETLPLSVFPESPLVELDTVVESGLCMGCGLCSSLADGAIDMIMTKEGRLRPVAREVLDLEFNKKFNAVCPGILVRGTEPSSIPAQADNDEIWGPAVELVIGYAKDPTVRFQATSGGVLTALSQFLLKLGRVNFVLHVGASKTSPVRSEARLSFDAAAVLEGAGARYCPVAPLADFDAVLARREPFALVGKPCDIAAARNLAKVDPRVDEYMRYALTFLCGGSSDLTKSEHALQQFGLREEDVESMRYRGFGSPGNTRIVSQDGQEYQLTYKEMWEDENGWMIQPRCKICPDPLGQGADIVAGDVWPGGSPIDDEGFNGIIVRTGRGLELFNEAVASGVLEIHRPMTFRDLDDFQPHQVLKRRSVWARYVGMRAAGMCAPQTIGLGITDLAKSNGVEANLSEARGARRRARTGRLGEPPARPAVGPKDE